MKKRGKWEDHYSRKAREENWPARSVYKLEEMDRRFRIIRKGDRVLDLGCYPGSWTKYSLKKTGKTGHVTGIDISGPPNIKSNNFNFIRADILEIEPHSLFKEIGPQEVVLSDLAPNTTGNRITDSIRSYELSEKALSIAVNTLKNGGIFVCKIFESEYLQKFKKDCQKHFHSVRLFRPGSVRAGSREIFVIASKKFNSP